MKDRIVKAWSTLSAGQGIALAGLLAFAAYIGVHLPPEVWERVAAKDPAELGAALGAFALAVCGVFAKPKDGAQ
jgi:multisubunit Na+/H+ antiporter MnhG subunit